MIQFCLIGSGTPLQKILPAFIPIGAKYISAVFLNTAYDKEAVKWCITNGVACFDANQLKTELSDETKAMLSVDWILNINSTVILRPEVLQLPRKGALNLHPGKLPEYAGLHTHQWAIRNGESNFGVTIHHMSAAVDEGDIAYAAAVEIKENDTGLSLFLRCLSEGTKLMQHAIAEILNGNDIPHLKQDLAKRHYYTYKMAKLGEIDFSLSAKQIFDFVRAADYAPFACPTYIPYLMANGEKYFIHKVKPSAVKTNPYQLLFNDNKLLLGLPDGCLEILKVSDEHGTKIADLKTLSNKYVSH